MREIHTEVKQWLGEDGNIGKFPKKRIIGNTDEKFIERR